MRDADVEAGVGCAPVTWAALALLVAGAVLWTAGILLEDPVRCTGGCEWAAFTLLFAGAPVSGLITVLGGSDLVLAWPVDALAWLVIAVLHTRLSTEQRPFSRPWNLATLAIMGVALAYGGVLSLLVERA